VIPLGFTLWVSMQLWISCWNIFFRVSKEKMEDEMIQKTRLDSLRFAAFVQMIVIIVGFLVMLLSGFVL